MTAPGRFPTLVAALDELSDAELQDLIARAQALLLDRPARADTTPPLAVEIVGREEHRLLTIYRALPALARGRVLRYMRLCYARARQALRRQPGAQAR